MYRRITSQERLAIGLRLHELSCNIAREGRPRQLLADCLRRFNGASLDYFITGSMASNYWGIQRSTHDIDVLLQFGVKDVDPKSMLMGMWCEARFVRG